MQCGKLPVVENPLREGGRHIEIFFVRVPASGSARAPDPVFFLSGGPGQASTPMAGMLAQMWAGIGGSRDLVLIDQRGTGRSNGLDCPVGGDPELAQTYLTGPFDPERYRTCLETLGARADLAAYTTGHIIGDLEQIRKALGYEQVNLFGASYGSRLGLEYMRLRPGAIRTAILEAVAPEFPRMLLTVAERLDQGIAALVGECATDEMCAEAYPKFESDLRGIVTQLRNEPVSIHLSKRGRRPEQTVTIDQAAFLTAVRYSLYSTPAARQLPQIVDKISDGDLDQLARFVTGRTRGAGAGVALGMNRSVRCAEVVAFTDVEQVKAAAATTLQGAQRADFEFDICDFWPTGEVHPEHDTPVVSEIPALLITGEHDYATPANHGRRAATHLANGEFVMLPAARHQLAGYDECLRGIYADFLDRGSASGLDMACTESAPAWPFRIEEQDDRDARKLRRTALDYIEGWYTGDAARMESSLHPDLAKRMTFVRRDGTSGLSEQTAEILVRMTGSRTNSPAEDVQRADIEILDRFEDAAIVRVDANDWVDFLQLVRWDGEWRILNVLWEPRSD